VNAKVRQTDRQTDRQGGRDIVEQPSVRQFSLAFKFNDNGNTQMILDIKFFVTDLLL
jgi:hypothetical protein